MEREGISRIMSFDVAFRMTTMFGRTRRCGCGGG
jgi:hypothetical protein